LPFFAIFTANKNLPMHLLGLDLGGTKLEAAILTEVGLEVVDRMRIDTEAHLGYDHIVARIVHIIRQISAKNNLQFDKVGIATPGTLDPMTNTMKNCNTTALNSRALRDDLSALLPGMVVNLSNDANCFAIAETNLGIVKNEMPEAKVVFGVIMGTGVGGGVVINGQVIGGRHGIGGEWGHNFLDESGGLCYCGKVGCVENVISGPATERFYQKISGSHKHLKDIVLDYRQGNAPFAQQTMNRLFENFGKAISVIINVLDPDAIVIGGGVGNIDELYTMGVEHVKSHIFNSGVVKTVFLKPKLGDSAGVFGAALL
jgi:fructokinase